MCLDLHTPHVLSMSWQFHHVLSQEDYFSKFLHQMYYFDGLFQLRFPEISGIILYLLSSVTLLYLQSFVLSLLHLLNHSRLNRTYAIYYRQKQQLQTP